MFPKPFGPAAAGSMTIIARRELVAALGSAVVAWPVAARAQQSAMPVVGFLNAGTATARAHFVAAVRQGLKESGYIEGQNVTVEYRWAEGAENARKLR